MFLIKTMNNHNHSYIQVLGELDCVNLPRLITLLDSVRNCDASDVHLDLRFCTYIDSSAVDVLIGQRRKRNDHFRLHFKKGSHVARVLGILGLVEFFGSTKAHFSVAS